MRKLGVRERWAVPVSAVAVVGVVAAASAVASASSAPSLPRRSAAQLLTEAAQSSAKPLGPFTATVQRSTDLGLPALPSSSTNGGGGGPFGAQSANGTTSIWYLNPQHIRIAQTTQMQESDLRLDGRTLWLWNSKTQTATKVALPARFSGIKGNVPVPSPRPGKPTGQGGFTVTPPTPAAAAQQLLKAVGPTTIVSVQRNVTVAGRPSYQLSLAPKSSQSLVGQVLIAIDASKHIPLRVEVIPRGSSSPAYEIGFTALTFGAPAMSNFSFTPPRGAKVKTQSVPSALPPGILSGLFGMLPSQPGLAIGCAGSTPPAVPLPKNLPKAKRASITKALQKLRAEQKKKSGACSASGVSTYVGGSAGNGASAGGPVYNDGNVAFALVAPAKIPATAKSPAGVTVDGTGWLSVLATAPSPALAAEVAQLTGAGGAAGSLSTSSSGSVSANGPDGSSEVIYATSPATPVGPDPAVLRALLHAMTPVHGSWGSGRLLRTSLLSVLITSNGRVLAGAVAPDVLYADVALPVK